MQKGSLPSIKVARELPYAPNLASATKWLIIMPTSKH
jgi:hypothetical protein